MTEFWVSKQSYLCKYCDIYIRDDAPSRAQHENGLRHQGNLERYIRDIYKKEDRLQKERTEEAIQVSKINEAARLAHLEKDLKQDPSSANPVKQEEGEGEKIEDETQKRIKHGKQDWKGAENLVNYSDARSLGLVDDEIEMSSKAEAEKELRATEGHIGHWEAVVKLPPVRKEKSERVSKIVEQKLASKLSNNRDPDKKAINKLFTERRLEDDSQEEETLQIKVKIDRRLQAQKLEPGLPLHGSIQPIRLDGLQEDLNQQVGDEGSSLKHSSTSQCVATEDQEDIKPTQQELQASAPAEPTILFKKRKLKHLKPHCKP